MLQTTIKERIDNWIADGYEFVITKITEKDRTGLHHESTVYANPDDPTDYVILHYNGDVTVTTCGFLECLIFC